MSFGIPASASGLVRVAPEDPCPCGAGRYDGCCGPLLAGGDAPTAEELMRSRYTAFVVGDLAHLARTWHPRTRPVDLTLDPETRWLGLTVVTTERGGAAAETGTVEFRAGWTAGDQRGELHERSRFVRRAGRWVYVDGEVHADPSG